MRNPDELQRRLLTYKSRVYQMKLFPYASDYSTIEWYEMQIEELEAELAVDELLCELEAEFTPPKLYKVETDCGANVMELCRDARVVKMEIKWSWRAFDWLFFVEYYERDSKSRRV